MKVQILQYIRQFWRYKNGRPHFENIKIRHFQCQMFQLVFCNNCFHKKRYMNWRLNKSCHLIPMFIETPCIRHLFLTTNCISGSDAYQDQVLHAFLAGRTIEEDFNDPIFTLSEWLYTVQLNVFNFLTIPHSHLNYHF